MVTPLDGIDTLSVIACNATSPKVGGLGKTTKFIFSPEAPPLGELLNEVKLRGRDR